MMSDGAILALLTWLTLLTTKILDEIRERRKSREQKELKEAQKQLKEAVEINTEVTIDKADGLYKKVDSAEKNVTEQATELGKVAKNVASQGVLAAHKASEQIRKVDDKLNGGEGGLHSMHDRMTRLEDGHEEFKKEVREGFGGVLKSIDHLSQSIQDRKMV